MDFEIRGKRFLLDGETLSLFSASFQYWRIQPHLWEPILEKVRQMGFGLIETYMPWSVHELSEGRFDFGEVDGEKDVAGFLRACENAGFKVLARPGPHINAELTYFGYPERIFNDMEIVARCADGSPVVLPAPPRMFPVPCYHHPRFLSEVKSYFGALAERVRDMIHPRGPIAAIQVDNECSKFFRTHPFDHDYCASSIRLYHRFLEGKYGSLQSLNEAYRSDYDDFSLVEPPRGFTPSSKEELPYYLDWVEYGSYYILRSLTGIAGILSETFGEGIPLFHNYPTLMPLPPFDIPAAERFLDFQGVDAYPQKTHYHTIRKGIKYTTASSRLPFLAEFSSGGIYYALPVALDDQEFTTWSALMHGIRGINFYMIVERERWYGSPVKADGSLRPRHFEFFRRLLSEVRQWGIEDLSPHAPVVLLINREYERLASAAMVPCPFSNLVADTLGAVEYPADLFISDQRFGLSEPVASNYARVWSFWYWALTAAGVHFTIGDTSFDSARLSDHEIVILPTFEFLGRRVQREVLRYVEAGGTAIIGPRVPRIDERMFPCRFLSEHIGHRSREGTSTGPATTGPFDPRREATLAAQKRPSYEMVEVNGGKLVHLDMVPPAICGPADGEAYGPLVDTLMRAGGVESDLVPSDSRVDVSILKGHQTLVLIANPTPEALEVQVSNRSMGRFEDLRTEEGFEGEGNIHLSLEPFSIRVLRRI